MRFAVSSDVSERERRLGTGVCEGCGAADGRRVQQQSPPPIACRFDPVHQDGWRSRRTRNQAPLEGLLTPCHRQASHRPRSRDREPRDRPPNHPQRLRGGLVPLAWDVYTFRGSDALGCGRRVLWHPTEKNAAGRECSRGRGRWQRGRRRLRRSRSYHHTATGLLTYTTTCVHTVTTCMHMAAGIAMAEAVETMVGQAAPSVLADEMMCPALREFGAPAQADRHTPDPMAPAHHNWPPAHGSPGPRRPLPRRREVCGGDGRLQRPALQVR